MPEDSVIITGSGSVSVELPAGYAAELPEGDAVETVTKGRKHFHDPKAYLVRLKINGNNVRNLNKHDVVEIVTSDGTP